MPIPFTCPHCGLQTLVDDRFAGQSGSCYQCKKIVSLPAYSETPSRKKKKSSGNRGIGTSISIVIVAVLAGLVAMVLVISAIIFIAGPAISTARDRTLRNQCKANLHQIGLALQQYEAAYGSFPPAYVADEKGKPMHSWRVLLLPYLNCPWIYNQYDFSQPWDSTQNINLVGQMPEVYRCPNDQLTLNLGETNYMVVIGPATLFPGQQAVSSQQIQDGTGNTIAVVEVQGEGVSWTQPTDLDVRNMLLAIDAGGNHNGGANVLLADGNVIFLQNDIPGEFIEALLTHSGGDRVPLEILESQ